MGLTTLNLGDISFPLRTSHNDNNYELTLSDLEHRSVLELRPRFSFLLHRNVYMGAAGSLGTSIRPTGEARSGLVEARLKSTISVGLRAFIGVTVPVGQRWQFNTEVAAGFRALIFNIETREVDCINHISRHRYDLKVEGRVGFDRFVSPTMSIGGFAGYDPVQHEGTVGLRLGVHTRSFDGQRRAEPTNR